MYGEFSNIYDKLVFDIDYFSYQNRIKEKVGFSDSMHVLELGCGSGNMTEYFQTDHYTGVDLSEEMIQIARQKFPTLQFVVDDILTYHSLETFDLIFTTLDTINYLLDLCDLQNMFYNIYDMLNQNAFFVFDLNSPYKLREVLGNNQFVYEYDDVFYTWVNQYYPQDQIVDFFLDFFIKEGEMYTRVHEEQTQRIYEPNWIQTILEMIGFSVRLYDFDTGTIPKEQTQRILFICKKESYATKVIHRT